MNVEPRGRLQRLQRCAASVRRGVRPAVLLLVVVWLWAWPDRNFGAVLDPPRAH